MGKSEKMNDKTTDDAIRNRLTRILSDRYGRTIAIGGNGREAAINCHKSNKLLTGKDFIACSYSSATSESAISL